ncbi:MAG: hypothetical protein MUO40_09890 [Anaerolineaceae bacterium]|nr:hypothetical protein [Anaerolineaceae bacterium]
MMKIIAFDPGEKRYQKFFLDFPFTLYKDNPQWVPPLKVDMKSVLQSKKHSFYQHGEAKFLLAINEKNEVIGRLAVMENRRYNDYFKSHSAFFYYFEAIDDHTVSRGLFEAGFHWAIQRGLTAMIGPKGFSVFDGFGTLIKGFEYLPAFGQVYNPPYYQQMLEELGFVKKWDAFTGYLPCTAPLPEKIFKAADIVQQKRNFSVKVFNSKSEIKKILPELQILYNKSLAEDAHNMPLSNEDMQTMANQLLKFADPHLIKLIYRYEEPVGFLLALPDISRALIRCKGDLFPLGWYHLLREFKKTKSVELSAIGVLAEHRRIGGIALLYAEIIKSIRSNPNFEYGIFTQLRDNNPNMIVEWDNLGVERRKTHRLYIKSL